MIDLHCHMLPGLDDGASNLDVSLEMARLFVADGVGIVACTPHMMPGVYNNLGADVRERVAALQTAIDEAGIPLSVVVGADVHVAPDLVKGLYSGELLALHDTRFVLIEPPHHVPPPRLKDLFFELMTAGFTPILTHPERLSWIDRRYDTIQQLFNAGVWMQLTAGSLLGSFGKQPRYWAERMLDEGMCHILATDAHDTKRRPPNLRAGFDAAATRVGVAEALNLVLHRPYSVLENRLASAIPALAGAAIASGERKTSGSKVGEGTLGLLGRVFNNAGILRRIRSGVKG